MARREPKLGIMLGIPSGKDDEDEEPTSESYDEEEEGAAELPPGVDSQLTRAFPELDAAGKEALVEAFRLCFEAWEREPHEEAEH